MPFNGLKGTIELIEHATKYMEGRLKLRLENSRGIYFQMVIWPRSDTELSSLGQRTMLSFITIFQFRPKSKNCLQNFMKNSLDYIFRGKIQMSVYYSHRYFLYFLCVLKHILILGQDVKSYLKMKICNHYISMLYKFEYKHFIS